MMPLFPRLSPIAARRWHIFRKNRRAYFSLYGLLLLLLISMCAPLIANDKPLFIRMNGHSYFPLLQDYSGRDFGFLLPGLNYKSASFANKLQAEKAFVIWPPIAFRYDTIDKNLTRGK